MLKGGLQLRPLLAHQGGVLGFDVGAVSGLGVQLQDGERHLLPARVLGALAEARLPLALVRLLVVEPVLCCQPQVLLQQHRTSVMTTSAACEINTPKMPCFPAITECHNMTQPHNISLLRALVNCCT